MDLDWLRLVVFVLSAVMYAYFKAGEHIERHYMDRLGTLKPPVAKYKIIDDSK